ncbi:uncharacterized protein LOC124275150 isoform X2 [Haliotis rubra]|uniref:uncharacterized protein LOC124275150 isoform X2 n=1 Tax=Haliotis rubra TaxID=36100 RepID=UPI001EE5E392|nr:uncharacterized protein LOC124275150 isoform X2 [Haliotis rubra]
MRVANYIDPPSQPSPNKTHSGHTQRTHTAMETDVRRVLLCVVIAELVLVIVLLKIVLHYIKQSTAGMPQEEVTDELKPDLVQCTTGNSDTNSIRNDVCDQDLINLNDSQELPNSRTDTGRSAKKVRELKQRNRYVHNYRTMGLQSCDDTDLTGLYSSTERFGSTDSHVYETLSLSSDMSDSNTRLSSSKTSNMSTKKEGEKSNTDSSGRLHALTTTRGRKFRGVVTENIYSQKINTRFHVFKRQT